MATRHTLDDAYRGGRVDPDAAAPAAAKPKLRYPCFAEQCPMPGTIFGGTTGTKDEAGCCAWHYGILPTDIPKVTRVLLDWQCVSAEVNAARRCLAGEAAADPRAQDEAYAAAWRRLAPQVELTGWAKNLEPKPRVPYGDWARMLEHFLGARVVEVLSTHRRSRA